MDLKSKIILISGPTASGKSSFAIKVAKKVDVADLELGHSVHMSEIKMPANVSHAVTVDDEHDSPVVSCYEPKAEKVEEVVEASSDDTADTPATEDKKEEASPDNTEENK